MPTIGTHRGVPLHAYQSAARIQVVKSAIDAVYEIGDAVALAAYAADPAHPPEARLFAAARCEATWQLAAESRAVRPIVNLALVRASVAGLGTRQWMSPSHYGSDLDPTGRLVKREQPIPAEDFG
ncbi:hypothetical protein ABS772_08800 [Methylorubrum podarium]|uniref:Uncharacterized protein n=1 Tax=Methylorubrum podarium TaxID=200476 RepID=A0ABV1QKY9_9HYPH